ncbi:MAG: hypothetical protein QG629_458 [Patescibacteria group bacterium]|nr:hypothetical protein [Candidatus Saccharibacteria bacterium]MDQ5963376.1 hypothetical protein [Patescibacteria group bacterium]
MTYEHTPKVLTEAEAGLIAYYKRGSSDREQNRGAYAASSADILGVSAMSGAAAMPPGSVQRTASSLHAEQPAELEQPMLHDPTIAKATEGGHAMPATNPHAASTAYSLENRILNPPPADSIG